MWWKYENERNEIISNLKDVLDIFLEKIPKDIDLVIKKKTLS